MRRAVLIALVGLVTAAMTPLTEVTATWASFTDSGDITGTTFTTYTVPPPTGVTCSRQAGSFRISWTAATGVTNYTVYINGSAVSTQTGVTYNDPAAATGRTINIVSNRVFTGVTWTSVQTATKTESIVGNTYTCP